MEYRITKPVHSATLPTVLKKNEEVMWSHTRIQYNVYDVLPVVIALYSNNLLAHDRKNGVNNKDLNLRPPGPRPGALTN